MRLLGDNATAEGICILEAAIEQWTGYVDKPANDDPGSRFLRSKRDRGGRFRLLSSLPIERLSGKARASVESERVALTEYHAYGLNRDSMPLVGKSMSTDQMGRASDKHLFNLFDELTDTLADEARDFRHGGIEQASIAFGELAKKSPLRVAAMLPKLNPDKQQKPVAYAIRNLGDSNFPSPELFQLIFDLENLGFIGSEFRGEAAHALSMRARLEDGLPRDICRLLERWLDEWTDFDYSNADCEGNDVEEGVQTILWRPSRGGALPSGTYWLLSALFYGYLRQSKPDYTSWMGCLERHLERPESIYTWKVISEELLNLGVSDARNLLTDLDSRPVNVSGRPVRRRRRRNRRS